MSFNHKKEQEMSKSEPTDSVTNITNIETENGTANRNQNDKRYEDPFEDESAPDDDFIDED